MVDFYHLSGKVGCPSGLAETDLEKLGLPELFPMVIVRVLRAYIPK